MAYCQKNYKMENKFTVKWDSSILADKDACILGMVTAAPAQDNLQEAINQVLEASWQFIPIITTEGASVLPYHGPYDHVINLKKDETPPWGPIYTLNKVKLEELRNWLKMMTQMGVVRESKSSCS